MKTNAEIRNHKAEVSHQAHAALATATAVNARSAGARSIAPRESQAERSNAPRSERHAGVVAWFDSKQGFGFISIQPLLAQALKMEAGFDLYVHGTDLVKKFPRSLNKGDQVEFSVELRAKGWRATQVTLNPQPKTINP